MKARGLLADTLASNCLSDPRRRIARVGEYLGAGLRLPVVQRGKAGLGHVDFAAHFGHLRRAFRQSEGQPGDMGEIGRHLFSHRTVTARRAVHQPAIFKPHGAAQPVDLGFSAQAHVGLFGQVQKTLHPRHKFARLVIAEHIVQAQHRFRMGDLGKAGGGL